LWYLQGVERMREDLDLLHTPHLVFKWYLDAFPALFRKSILRNISLDSQSPDTILKLSVAELIEQRPVFVDFSTRYSVQLGEYGIAQRGLCYQLAKGASAQIAPDLSVWSRYSIRGVGGEMFFRDLDTSKAILIYAYSHMESGETFLRLGRIAEGVAEMRIAEKTAPELHDQVAQIIRNHGM